MSFKSVCETCGMTINEEAQFCPTCGSRMKIIQESPKKVNETEELKNAENINNEQNAKPEPEITTSGNPALDAAMNNNSSVSDSSSVPPTNFNNSDNSNMNIPPVPPVGSGIPPINPSNGYSNPYQPQPPAPKTAKDTMALVGMILGIVSLALCCLNLLMLPVAIAGLVLGIIGVKSVSRKGMAIAAIVCSAIAVVLCISIFSSGVSKMKEAEPYYSDLFEDIFEDDDLDDLFDDYKYEYHYDWD